MQQKNRHEELKKELIEKLNELQTNEDEIIRKEEELEKEIEKWEQEKAERMATVMQLEQQIQLMHARTYLRAESTRQPTLIMEYESVPLKTTGAVTVVTEAVTVITTEDKLEKEVRALEEQVVARKEHLKEKEDRLMEKKRKLLQEKEDINRKIQELEEQLLTKKAGVPPNDTQRPDTVTTPSVTQLPPTERTTIEIWEPTVPKVLKETTIRRRITLHKEEKDERDYESEPHVLKEEDVTTRICLNVLKNASLGRDGQKLVTEKVCLPFVPGKKGLVLKDREEAEEKTKIDR